MPKQSAHSFNGRGDPTRQSSSCSECRRRKEKCDRVWPCGQCKRRKVQHECRFGCIKSPGTLSDTSGPNALRQKRSLTDSDTSSLSLGQDLDVDFSTGLSLWGYTTTSDLFNLQSILDTKARTVPIGPKPQSKELKNALLVLPNRGLIDKLVQSYIYGANYRYYLVYPPTFLEEYSRFWDDKMSGYPDPEFTCLLLRVCALSAQHLTDALREELEGEVGENAALLTKRYHKAAEAIHNTFPPGTGGLMRVQQLLVKVTWCKGDGDCIAAWHAVKSAVGEAQEIGMDQEVFPQPLSEFEIEMRRRVWCLCYVWDWQMSMWLGRPLIIDQRRCNFVLPNLRLDESSNHPGLPSPFTHMLLQAALCQNMAKALVEADNTSPEFIKKQQQQFEVWIKTLPPIYSVSTPDTRWDENFPYIVQQRHQLHTVTFMLKLGSLKQYLTCTAGPDLVKHEAEFRSMAVDTALQLVDATESLYDFEYPIHSNFHLVVFCLFDTAVTLCSAILHDIGYNLPRRPEVLDRINLSLQTLAKLSRTTASAPVSYSIVCTLVGKFRLAAGEKSPFDARPDNTSKRLKQSRISSSGSQPLATPVSSGSRYANASASASTVSTNTNLSVNRRQASFPTSQPLLPDPTYQVVEAAYPNFTGIPMGGMENMINWGNYHIMPEEFGPLSPMNGYSDVAFSVPQYPPTSH